MAYTVKKLSEISGVTVRTLHYYAEHPQFRKQLDPFHPKLAEFMADAMRVFADRELS
jgi:DNA-binding transcriptional MerR regulator